MLGNGCNLSFTPLLVHFKRRYRAAPFMAPATPTAWRQLVEGAVVPVVLVILVILVVFVFVGVGLAEIV